MNSLFILEIPGMNINGDVWVWKIFLSFMNDKTFSVGAIQFIKGIESQRIPAISFLKNGKEVKDGLKLLLADVNFIDYLVDDDIRNDALNSCISAIESNNTTLSSPLNKLNFK
jgi:hypothetical protein